MGSISFPRSIASATPSAIPTRLSVLFKHVPFLNRGLFECLDREVSDRDLERSPDLKKRLVKEGSRDVIRIEAFPSGQITRSSAEQDFLRHQGKGRSQ